jgi:hypothetical protein
MDKQKQIDEMTKVKIGAILEKINMGDGYANIDSLADEIYHIAIPEGAVVLTKEAYDKLQALKGDYVKGYEAGVDEGWDNAVTQTAEKFAELVKSNMKERDYMGVKYKQGVFTDRDIDGICKEITEGKDDDTSQVGK